VLAGKTINVTLSVRRPEAFTRGIGIIGETTLGATPVKDGPPFGFALTMPSNLLPGSYKLTAAGSGARPHRLATASITPHVKPSSGLPSLVSLSEGPSFEAVGGHLALRITGAAASGQAVNQAAPSSLGSACADSSIATVDSPELVTAVEPGGTGGNLTFNESFVRSMPIRLVAPPVIPSVSSLHFGDQAVGWQNPDQTFTLRKAPPYPLRILDATSSNEFPGASNCRASLPIPVGGIVHGSRVVRAESVWTPQWSYRYHHQRHGGADMYLL
jgi:hypothetical protein